MLQISRASLDNDFVELDKMQVNIQGGRTTHLTEVLVVSDVKAVYYKDETHLTGMHLAMKGTQPLWSLNPSVF